MKVSPIAYFVVTFLILMIILTAISVVTYGFGLLIMWLRSQPLLLVVFVCILIISSVGSVLLTITYFKRNMFLDR